MHKKPTDELKTSKTPARKRPKASNVAEKRRALKVYSLLVQEYPDAKVALNFKTPFELLVATILSAQCTDARVNMVTPGLFRKYPTPASFAKAVPEELEQDIRSTGFYRQKAKSVMSCSRSVVEKFGGEVPRSMDELLTLEGVGRKTANVLLGNAFGIPGIAVDTHVGRLAQRLGFTKEDDPIKIEYDLMELFPKENWTELCHLLMSHGRQVCASRLPKCETCTVSGLCPSAFKVAAKGKSKKRKGK
jgi:endonuclease III